MNEDIKLVNLTPHTITLLLEGNIAIDILASGSIARREEIRESLGTFRVGENDVPLFTKHYGHHESLPPEAPNIYYVVSVLTALQSTRHDLLTPDQPCRSSEGKTIGCKGLSFVTKAP